MTTVQRLVHYPHLQSPPLCMALCTHPHTSHVHQHTISSSTIHCMYITYDCTLPPNLYNITSSGSHTVTHRHMSHDYHILHGYWMFVCILCTHIPYNPSTCFLPTMCCLGYNVLPGLQIVTWPSCMYTQFELYTQVSEQNWFQFQELTISMYISNATTTFTTDTESYSVDAKSTIHTGAPFTQEHHSHRSTIHIGAPFTSEHHSHMSTIHT